MATFREVDDKNGMAYALNILGEMHRQIEEDEPAQQYYEESLAIVRDTGERLREAYLLTNLSFIATHERDDQRSYELNRSAYQIMQKLDNPYEMACCSWSMAGPIAMLGKPEHAAQLLGAAGEVYEYLDTMMRAKLPWRRWKK